MKRLRLILLLLVLIPVIPITWLLATQSGLHWAMTQAAAYLPSTLSVQQISGSLSGPITFNQVAYTREDAAFRAEKIIFDWRLSALLTANIDINQLNIQSLEIVLPDKSADAQAQTQANNIQLPDIQLPWNTVIRNAEINGIHLQQGEQEMALESLRLRASTLFSQVDIRQLEVSAETFRLKISGSLHAEGDYRHALKVEWLATLPSKAKLEGRGEIRGDMNSTRFTQKLTGPLQLDLDGKINKLLQELGWQVSVDARQFDLAQLDTQLPALSGTLKFEAHGDLATATLKGRLDGNMTDTGAFDAEFNLQRMADNTVQIDALKLHSALTNTQLDANGHWLPASNGGEIDVALNWKNLRWPMLHEPTWFNSASGNGTIAGTLDAYRIALNTDSPWPQYLPSTWQASASGNLRGMEIQSLNVAALNGQASATGTLDWSTHFNWKAEVSANDIDPAVMYPQWPGKLAAKLSSSGRYENNKLIADADISQLKGNLRGYPVKLRSRLGWKNNALNITKLDAHSGESRLTLNGVAGDTLNLDWSIASSKLAELYPGSQGQLQSNGTITGPRTSPSIKAEIDGKALKLHAYEIGAIRGKLDVDLFSWQQIAINLDAQALTLNTVSLQTLNINAENKRMQAKAVSKFATTELELQGETYAQGWRGQITRANVNSKRFDQWQLEKPVALDVTQNKLDIDPLCWHSDKEAQLCAALEQKDTAWHSRIDAKQLPLLLLSPWLPPDMNIEGVANASATMKFQPPQKLDGQVLVQLPAGAVSYPLIEGERERWEYRSGKLLLSLDDKTLLANTDFAMTNGDRLHAELSMPGFNLFSFDPSEQTLKASAQLSIHTLGIIESVVPEIQDLKGNAELNMAMTGTLAQPRLNGRARLLDGGLRIPRLGLNIEQLSMKAQSDGFEKLSFGLDARSGEGKLAVTGTTQLDSNAGWPTDIAIKGKEFEVSRIPEARVQVTPDLLVKLQHRSIDISGSVHVPYAKLQPRDITTAARASDDVVIIGGKSEAEQKWTTVTRVRVTLGDRVNFNGFGFEGRFGGSLLVEDEPGQLTRATGEVTVPEGRYRAYGQRLDVEHGRVIFTGGPLANPGLDLRAVRHVNEVTAGIRVRGSLHTPELELFSIPTMGETDVLSYLLLGRPIENASDEEGAMMAKATLALGLSGGDRIARLLGDRFGLDEMRVESSDSGDQASLVVGRYLSPKLYVSYGVGLIEAINTLSVRYQINDKWQLKAESGEAQGADIFYTIER